MPTASTWSRKIGAGALKRAAGPIALMLHPGEAARLLGMSTAEVNADCIGAARRLSESSGAAVLLKGARTVIAGTGGGILRQRERESRDGDAGDGRRACLG